MVSWGTATLVGVVAGLLYGGSKEASASASKDAEVVLKMGSTPDKREQYKLMREAMENRFIRISKGALVGGAQLGAFTASFFGVRNYLADERGVEDVWNVVGAGSATAATLGLVLPGSVRWRARNVLLGSVLGAGICFPLGWLQVRLTESANLQLKKSQSESDLNVGSEVNHKKTRVGAAIEKLEARLQKK